MAAELTSYINEAREKHVSDEEIKNQLVTVGWPAEQVISALSQSVDIPVPPPPPPSITHVGMWIGFLYILFFISLYVLATAIAGIFHTWIDKPLFNTDFSDYAWYSLPEAFGVEMETIVRGYIAAIIVSYPLFLVFFLILKNQLTKQPVTRNLRSRKILIYITLIGTFLILLGSIIVTCYDLLAGSITSKIVSHLLITLLITGPIFFYFFTEVKNNQIMHNKEKLAIVYMTLLTLISIVVGFSIIPFPGTEKNIINDHKRVIDLGTLQQAIDNYYMTNHQLPPSLDQLNNSLYATTPLNKVDPQTQQHYGYSITGPLNYKICATFSTSSSQDNPNAYDNENGDYADYSSQFKHPEGYYCFNENEQNNPALDIQPSNYSCVGACPEKSQSSSDSAQSEDITPTPVSGGQG